MKTRIVTALVAIAGVLVLLCFRTSIAVPIVVMFLTALAAHEIFKTTNNKRRIVFYIATLVYLAAAPFTALSYIPFITLEYWTLIYGFVFAVSLLIRFEANDVPRQFLCAGMAAWVAYGIGSILRLMAGEHGVYLFFVGGLCAWMCDAGAYFAGTLLGRHKLCPTISPKKTVEGAVGGVLSCVISVIIMALIYKAIVPQATVMYLPLIVFALVGSVIGMVGDLFASAIKRCYGIKDFGTLFPGHGGVLDRVDSAMFVFPLLMIFHSLIPLIA